MSKKACRECPWVNTNRNSLNFRKHLEKMKTIDIKKHACHMITTDIWGYKNIIDSNNTCKGQNINKEDEKY